MLSRPSGSVGRCVRGRAAGYDTSRRWYQPTTPRTRGFSIGLQLDPRMTCAGQTLRCGPVALSLRTRSTPTSSVGSPTHKIRVHQRHGSSLSGDRCGNPNVPRSQRYSRTTRLRPMIAGSACGRDTAGPSSPGWVNTPPASRWSIDGACCSEVEYGRPARFGRRTGFKARRCGGRRTEPGASRVSSTSTRPTSPRALPRCGRSSTLQLSRSWNAAPTRTSTMARTPLPTTGPDPLIPGRLRAHRR
jgi:hypothetical protein